MKEKLIAKLLNCFIATTEKNNLTMATASDAVQQCNNRKTPNGFTLIELVIVTALVGIMVAIGTAGLVDYTRTAELNAAVNELKTTLNVAKSNALSQVKDPTLCPDTDVLNGYKVTINNSTTYDLFVQCGGIDYVIKTKSLPANIIFSSITPASFFFPVLTGGVIGSGTVTLSGYAKTKSVIIDAGGVIR